VVEAVVPMVIERTVVILVAHDAVVPMVIERTVVIDVALGFVAERIELDAAEAQNFLLPMRM